MERLMILPALVLSASAVFWSDPPAPASPPAATPAVPQALPPLAVDWSAVDTLARRWVNEVGLPGAALYVAHDGRVLHEAYYGDYKASTVVPIASASKWLSGAVLMSLVDDKTVDLDAPVGNVLTDLPEEKKALTLRRLFSHTSGLPSEVAGAARWTVSIDDAARAIAETAMVSEPGKEFRYGGASMQLAAAVVVKASGKDWHGLFKDRVASPCGMTNTQYGRLGTTPNPQVAGGASSTLGDYARFLTMLAGKGVLDGKRVLSEAAVREMLKDQTAGAEMKKASLMRVLGGDGYGIGNWVDAKSAKGEPAANSSPGAFGFTPWIDHERKIVAVWMVCDREKDRRRAQIKGLEHPREAVTKAVDAAIKVRESANADKPGEGTPGSK
jgi:CubicO group peptidase (beta-lactamase class C family)